MAAEVLPGHAAPGGRPKPAGAGPSPVNGPQTLEHAHPRHAVPLGTTLNDRRPRARAGASGGYRGGAINAPPL